LIDNRGVMDHVMQKSTPSHGRVLYSRMTVRYGDGYKPMVRSTRESTSGHAGMRENENEPKLKRHHISEDFTIRRTSRNGGRARKKRFNGNNQIRRPDGRDLGVIARGDATLGEGALLSASGVAGFARKIIPESRLF